MQKKSACKRGICVGEHRPRLARLWSKGDAGIKKRDQLDDGEGFGDPCCRSCRSVVPCISPFQPAKPMESTTMTKLSSFMFHPDKGDFNGTKGNIANGLGERANSISDLYSKKT